METSSGRDMRRESPASPSAASAAQPDRIYYPGQAKSLAGIATRAFCLGVGLAVGVFGTAMLLPYTPLWRLPWFLAALSAFHFLEFWTTAAYNTRAAETASFLLTSNWPGYALAHLAACVECLVVGLAFRFSSSSSSSSSSYYHLHYSNPLTLTGLALVLVGQTVRTAAMCQAGPSFNHLVQQRRGPAHVLVTGGVYAALRHPSYFGFFWWAVGTQLVLGNWFCAVAYAAVLWRFFRDRIRNEEEFLVRFFGDEYVDYRAKVGTKIPFIR